MSKRVHAWIGLGSNLEDPLEQLARAVTGLATLPDTTLVGQSAFYRSRPVGPQDQPDFSNAVVLLETALSPETLLDHLQQLEQAHGRVRLRRWGPRTLDLDLLLYGCETISTPRLAVPHPRLAERDFVLRPKTTRASGRYRPCHTSSLALTLTAILHVRSGCTQSC